jgi:hypothetical protein
MFVSVQDPKVTPIRLSSSVVRVFPIDTGLAFVERPLGVPGAPIIFCVVDAIAGTATCFIDGTHITIVRSASTIFGPDVFHSAVRRDETVVFAPNTRV